VTLEDAAVVAQVLAAWAAVLLAKKRRDHAPAAVALVLLAAASVLKYPVLAAHRPLPRPVEGAARALIYADGALSMSFNAIVAGLPVALAVSPTQRRHASWIIVGAWSLASVALGALYPSPYVRGAGLQQVYVAADFIGLAVAALALITEARADIAANRQPSSASAVATALVILDGGLLVVPFSPWHGDVFVQPFFGPQLVITSVFSLIAATEVIAWQFTSSRG
jgi:hypothetical protein